MPTNPRPTTNGNTPEDWQVFEVLFGADQDPKSIPARMTTMSPLPQPAISFCQTIGQKLHTSFSVSGQVENFHRISIHLACGVRTRVRESVVDIAFDTSPLGAM
ncbi:GM17076 [Drosophila sechellia]|uniref:GM17076 n=1 Tax=Drosophila sechellia TaxID=7238 RepID=B4I5I7_DROSE|nr:GM17076 [Drosophila sechellia]